MQRPGFVYTIRHERGDRVVNVAQTHNLMPIEGINYMFDTAFGGTGQQPKWYVSLYKTPFVPTPDTKMADLMSLTTEMTAYTPTHRPQLTFSAAANGTVVSNEVELRVTEAQIVYGAFLSSDQQKDSNVGILGSIALFDVPKSYGVGDKVFLLVEQQLISD